MGREYWAKLRELVDNMQRAGTINVDDMRYVHYTDSVEELSSYISTAVQKFGVIARPSPSRILGESGLNTPDAKSKAEGVRP
jgi:predicted Rossmann-fold nucleotide-binding protein